MRSVGLDLGVRKIGLCEVGPDGTVVARATVRQRSELEPFLGPDAPPARVAIEACREAWHAHRVLSDWRNEVHLLDTTRVKQRLGIGQHGRKNDRIDAERIARASLEASCPKRTCCRDRASACATCRL